MSPRNSSWWQAPRRVADRIGDRRVTFLELFYDLVFVVIIAETAHRFATHLDGHGALVYAGMFTVIWWAWMNGTMYHELHGNDDLRTRVFTFLQMIAVAAMAAFAYEAVGEYSGHFAIAYAALQLILSFLWFMTGVADPDHRPLSVPYVVNMLVSAGLFIGSVFVPESTRYTFWLIAMIVALIGSQMPVFLARWLRPEVRAQAERSRAPSESGVERFGLFTIIVLGEVIVGVVGGVIDHEHLTVTVGAIALLGMLVAIGLWWIYFDFISLQLPRESLFAGGMWFYLHIPLTMGIAATGAAILYAVEHSPGTPGPTQRLILVGAVATAMLSVAALGALTQGSELHLKYRRTARRFLVPCAGIAIVIGVLDTGILVLLGSLVVLLLAPVAAGFVTLVRNHRPQAS